MQLVRTVLAGGYRPELGMADISTPKTPQVSYKDAKSQVINAFTHDYVKKLLTQTGGNISEAARISGLSRVALQKILARMGEKAATFRLNGLL